MKIRKAVLGDLKQIQDLYYELQILEARDFVPSLKTKWVYTKRGTEHFMKKIKENDCFTFVCEDSDKLIGFISGTLFKKTSVFERRGLVGAELDHIIVLEDFRGKGIGDKLTEMFFEWAKKKKATKVRVKPFIKNTKGINFYRKIGFKDYSLNLEKDL